MNILVFIVENNCIFSSFKIFSIVTKCGLFCWWMNGMVDVHVCIFFPGNSLLILCLPLLSFLFWYHSRTQSSKILVTNNLSIKPMEFLISLENDIFLPHNYLRKMIILGFFETISYIYFHHYLQYAFFGLYQLREIINVSWF